MDSLEAWHSHIKVYAEEKKRGKSRRKSQASQADVDVSLFATADLIQLIHLPLDCLLYLVWFFSLWSPFLDTSSTTFSCFFSLRKFSNRSLLWLHHLFFLQYWLRRRFDHLLHHRHWHWTIWCFFRYHLHSPPSFLSHNCCVRAAVRFDSSLSHNCCVRAAVRLILLVYCLREFSWLFLILLFFSLSSSLLIMSSSSIKYFSTNSLSATR